MHTLRFMLLATVAIVVLAACGGGSAASASPPPDADATVDARDNRFEPGEIAVPAGESSQVFFRNLDPAPHNIAVYTDDSASQSVFVGDVISDAATVYELPAMESGDYFFRCDVHPDMTGTVVVGEA